MNRNIKGLYSSHLTGVALLVSAQLRFNLPKSNFNLKEFYARL